VAIDDVLGKPEAGGAADEVIELAPGANEKGLAGRPGAEPGIIEGELFGRVDDRVGAAARCAIELVDVGAQLVETLSAALAGTVGKDENVLRQRPLPQLALPDFAAATCAKQRRRRWKRAR